MALAVELGPLVVDGGEEGRSDEGAAGVRGGGMGASAVETGGSMLADLRAAAAIAWLVVVVAGKGGWACWPGRVEGMEAGGSMGGGDVCRTGGREEAGAQGHCVWCAQRVL